MGGAVKNSGALSQLEISIRPIKINKRQKQKRIFVQPPWLKKNAF